MKTICLSENYIPSLLRKWVISANLEYPESVNIRESNAEDNLNKVTRAFSLELAGSYAIWELIHSGYLTPAGLNSAKELHVEYSTVVAGSGSMGGIDFPDLQYSHPERVYKIIESSRRSILTDGDMYLQDLGLSDLHLGIKEALCEAAHCFRYDLYTGTVVMLGAALEGVWIELGRSLVQARPGSTKADKISKALDFSSRGIGYLVKQIVEMCESRDESGDIVKQANVTLEDIRSAALWWDTIREARNVLHWEIEAAIPNSFDKVATLMLSAASNLRTLWNIRTAAISLKP